VKFEEPEQASWWQVALVIAAAGMLIGLVVYSIVEIFVKVFSGK
jgi:dipeptide/tripeptide permease